MAATTRVGIQADDLTGACDVGAPFAARGLETLVLVPGAAQPDDAPQVLVVDTESRALPPDEARERAREAARQLRAAKAVLLYKKMDSTLRGPLAAELAGMLDGASLAAALLAPAFPAQGRTVSLGMVRVDGHLAEDTPIARDPLFPRTGASVPALLAAGGEHPVGVIPLATVRRGASAVAARIDRFTRTGGRALVADAEIDADLCVVAAAGESTLLAGSAGLAAAVAARLPAAGPPDPCQPRRPLLVVAGSAHPVTRVQITRLAARVGAATILAPDREPAADAGHRATVAAGLAAAALARITEARPGTLVLVGGETAFAVCRALEARGLRLSGEIERGLAVGVLVGGAAAGLLTITKAGGFGDPDTLVRLWEAGR